MEGNEDMDMRQIARVDYPAYRVSDYLGWQQDGSLVLRPRFQRGSVWESTDRSLLIDSLLRGFPVPAVVLAQEWDSAHGRMSKRVVDGQQRLRTLIYYVLGESALPEPTPQDRFAYRPRIGTSRKAFSFAELSQEQQRRIVNAGFPAVSIEAGVDEAYVLEVYERLNTTGKGLTPQEVRFVRGDSEFARLSYDLARQNQSRWLDWRVLTNKQVSRMNDVQLTSEIALLLSQGIGTSSKAELDRAYGAQPPMQIDPLYIRTAFQHIMDALESAFAHPPARYDLLAPLRTRAWLYSLFSFFMFTMGLLDEEGRRSDDDEGPLGSILTREAGIPRIPATIHVPTLVQHFAVTFAEHRLTSSSLDRAVTGAASDKGARMERFRFLVKTSQRVRSDL